MKGATQDALAYGALEWAFGSSAMTPRQHRQIKAVAREAKIQSYESRGLRRSRYWGLGPVWPRRTP